MLWSRGYMGSYWNYNISVNWLVKKHIHKVIAVIYKQNQLHIELKMPSYHIREIGLEK